MKSGAWILLGMAAGASACSTIFGDVVFVNKGSGGGATATSTSTAGMEGGPTGTGGEAPSFTFAITDATVNVPYGGLNYVHLEITPIGGFDGAVGVTAQEAPSGLVTMPLTITAGNTTGMIEIGAETTLTLGTTFNLTLAATSGAIAKTATVPAVVTGKPGAFDMMFGSSGVVTGPTSAGFVSLNDIQEVAASKILVGGTNSPTADGTGSTALGLRYLSNGTPDLDFNGTGSVSGTFCSACQNTAAGNVARVAVEPDSTVLLVGSGQASDLAAKDVFVFRYNDDGTANTLLNEPGPEDIGFGGSATVTAAALVPNSVNVIVGGSNGNGLVVARVADQFSSGKPDTTFAAPNGWIAPRSGA